MQRPDSRLILLCAYMLQLSARAAADLGMDFDKLNPKTYSSPTGQYSLRVDPSSKYGGGEGDYRMTRGGAELWSKKLPFTLWDAAVTDEGVVAGYAYSLGRENVRVEDGKHENGRLHMVILDPQGVLRMNEMLPRTGTFSCTSTVDRNVRGLIVDTENDRFIVRCTEGGWLSRGETWRVFRLSTGKPLDEFQFDHPRSGARDWWSVEDARPVAGTQLILVSWQYHQYDESGNNLQAEGASYGLFDSDGTAAWELIRPNDLTAQYAILRTDQPRSFDLWFVAEKQRVTFEATRDPAQRWLISERGRTEFASNPREPERKPAALDRLELRHLGAIQLEPDDPPPPVRDIIDFSFNSFGQIAMLRAEPDGSRSLVLVETDGTLIDEFPLPPEAESANVFGLSLAWIDANRCIVAANTWDDAEGNKRKPVLRVWIFDNEEQSFSLFIQRTDESLTGLTADRNGQFVLVVQSDVSAPAKVYVITFDAAGREIWCHVPECDWLRNTSPPAVTEEGLVIIPYSTGSFVTVLDRYGRFLRYDNCEKVFGEEGGRIESVASDGRGGMYLQFSMSPIWHVRSDWSYISKLWLRHPDNRAIRVPNNGVRVDPAGAVWVSDCHALLRLNEAGVVDRILGEPPDAPALRNISTVAIDQVGTIYAVEDRDGAVHVFDAAGKRVRRMRPEPDDFKEEWGELSVARDGTALLGGLEFSAGGDRVGVRQAPDGLSGPDAFGARLLAHPNSRRCWVAAQGSVHLLDENNKLVRTLLRHADGTWLDGIETAAVDADGKLAIVAADWGANRQVTIFDQNGAAIAGAAFPALPDAWFNPERLAFSGRYVLSGPWGDASRFVALDIAANPPTWYDLGDIRPYADTWRYFFVKDGKELWMFAEEARRVERFEIVTPEKSTANASSAR